MDQRNGSSIGVGRGAIALTIRVLLMVSSMRGGGSEQQTLLLLRHLDRNKFAPHLYLTHREGDLLSQVPSDVRVHCLSLTQPAINLPGRILRQQISGLASMLTENQIDVVYDRTFHMTLIAGPAARTTGVPRVSTIVSPPDQALPLVEKRFVGWKRHRLAVAYRNAKQVIAVSRAAADSAIHYYKLSPDRVEVVPNPVDASAIHDRPRTAVNREGHGCTLACVGRMTREKGHADLIAALQMTEATWSGPAIQVWFVGDGPLRTQLQTLADQSLNLHRIHFVGHQADPAAWIASADGLILPSRFEGMPNVVLEAMAIGKPVIATASGGTPELQSDPPTMFLANACDPRSLADQINAFVQNPKLRNEHVSAATELIHQKHDVAKTTRRIESILEQAATGLSDR